MDFLFGILAGVFVSILTHLYKVKISPPKLIFGEEICRTTYADQTIGFKYIYKNSGKRRLIDVSIKAHIKLPGLSKQNPKLNQIIRFNTDNHDRFIINPGKEISNKLIINTESIRNNKFISLSLKSKIDADEEITIEDLFELSPQAKIQIFVMGNDELTGLRKAFESKEYTKNSITNGIFDRKTLVVTRAT